MSMETWKPRRFVEEFQKRAGLLIDGVAGPQTRMALWLIPEPPMGGHWYQPVETTKADPLIPPASTTVHFPLTFADTPTPIDPADIRPGDVVRGRREIEVTVQKVEPGVIIDQRGDGWRTSVWDFFIVHRPDPDAEAVEALLAAGLTDDANLIESDTARIARRYLANLREQGWEVTRRQNGQEHA